MTGEEREAAQEYKDSISAELKATDLGRYRYALVDTDRRIGDYVSTVINNPERHNVYEQLGVKRFLQMLDKYQWKPKRAKRFFKFYETLRFSGTSGRTRYRLTPVQTFQMANIYGLADNSGRRLIQDAYIFVPRKFSKTTMAAAMAVYDMLFGDNNAQAYVAANSYSQAKICFEEVRKIMRDIDPRERHFKINREEVSFRDRGHDSSINCLSADAKTKDGLFASLVIMDEYSQARNTAGKNGADLKNTLTTSMGPRYEPLTVIITTASEVVDGPFVHELDGVKKVMKGEVEADRIFASLFMPDAGDREDDPLTWAKVQPHLGITVQPDFYQREWEKAQFSAENLLAFRTKLLNVFTINTEKTWFTYEKAKELVGNFSIDAVAGRPSCAVAFDLSVRDDFSAVTYTLYASESKRFYAHTDYYFPAGSLQGHPNAELYKLWNKQGYLTFCEGDKIDVRRIADDIIRRAKKLNIIRIGYDAWKAKDLVNILASTGGQGVLKPYSQTYGSFNLPVESFEMLAYDTPPRITINNNPINIFCLTNCVIDEDNLENKKPVKISQNRKIDGAVTLLMTLGLLYSYER